MNKINTVGELVEFLQQYDTDMQLIVNKNGQVVDFDTNDFTIKKDSYNYKNNEYMELDIR